MTGRDLPPALAASLAENLARYAAESGVVRQVHDVRVRETDAGLVVNYHCRVDPALTVADVHNAVDQLDRKIKIDQPGICRVVGHAEPFTMQ